MLFRSKVDLGDYAAHVMFHAHHPEYLAPYIAKFNDVQKRHSEGQHICDSDPVLKKLNSNDSLVATNYPVYEGKNVANSEQDPPPVLIMHRKSIRLFPNGQKVAMYYIDKLNKYVTVPYDGIMQIVPEETILNKVKISANEKQKIVVEHLDGSITEITPEIAKNIMNVYQKINDANKQKMADMLEASAKHFQTIVKFSKE